jgi:hypothetical protein
MTIECSVPYDPQVLVARPLRPSGQEESMAAWFARAVREALAPKLGRAAFR